MYFDFLRIFLNKYDLICVVSSFLKKFGDFDLVKVLESVMKVYELKQVWLNVKKVLVVILDNKIVNIVDELIKKVVVIVDKGILVIGVGVGNLIDFKEL